MAMISCEECGAQVSTRAAACPKCGFPLSGSSSKGESHGKEKKAGSGISPRFVIGCVVVCFCAVVVLGLWREIGNMLTGAKKVGEMQARQNNANVGNDNPGSKFNGGDGRQNLPNGQQPIEPVPLAAPPKKDLVGRWDVVRSGKLSGNEVAGYMRFNRNGTFSSTLAFLATTDGKYLVFSAAAVELDFPGVVYGRNKVEFRYAMNGDSLTLAASTHLLDLEFRRVDSGE